MGWVMIVWCLQGFIGIFVFIFVIVLMSLVQVLVVLIIILVFIVFLLVFRFFILLFLIMKFLILVYLMSFVLNFLVWRVNFVVEWNGLVFLLVGFQEVVMILFMLRRGIIFLVFLGVMSFVGMLNLFCIVMFFLKVLIFLLLQSRKRQFVCWNGKLYFLLYFFQSLMECFMIWMFVLLLNCCFILVLQWNVEFEFMKCFFMMVIFLFFLVSLWVMVMLMILLLIIVILFFLGSFFVGILIFFCDDFYFDVFYRWFCNGYVKFVYVYFVLLGNEKGVVEQVEFVLVEVYGQVGEFFDDLQVCYVVFDDVVYFFQCDVIVVYLDVFVVEVIE